MKKIKFYIVLYLIVLCISICGIAIGIGFAKIQESHPEYLSAGLIKGIIIFLFAQLFSVYLHEIIHVITYKLQGINIRMLYLFPLCIVKEENKFKFYITFNLQIGFGGIVIPELPNISNDEEYNSFRNKMSLSVICAPLFSALIGIFSLILVCTATEYINYDNRSYYFIFFIAMVFWSIYINVMSFLNLGTIVGDYLGAKKIKTDEVYTLLQIYNYFLLQENKTKRAVRYKQNYLVNRIRQKVEELSLDKSDNTMQFLLADSLLYELIMQDRECTTYLSEQETLNKIFESIQGRLQFEAYSCFFAHAIMYLNICGKTNEAIYLWERYNGKMAKTKTGNYRFRQVELFLYGKGINDFNYNNDIEISSMDSLLSKVCNYYDDEVYLNNLIINNCK